MLLSLSWPGAGHLYARRWIGVIWLAVAVANWLSPFALTVRALAHVALGGLAARRAYLHLAGGPRPAAPVDCTLEGGRVRVRTTIDVAVWPRAALWAYVSDLARFCRADPFHDVVERDGDTLVLDHCVFGLRFTRIGRVLSWREGESYSFSDLSVRGPGVGFPHAFVVSVADGRIDLEVAGRWTARWLPRALSRAWLRAVVRAHVRLIRGALATEARALCTA